MYIQEYMNRNGPYSEPNIQTYLKRTEGLKSTEKYLPHFCVHIHNMLHHLPRILKIFCGNGYSISQSNFDESLRIDRHLEWKIHRTPWVGFTLFQHSRRSFTDVGACYELRAKHISFSPIEKNRPFFSFLFFSPLVLFNNMAIYGLFHLNRTLHRFPCEKVGVRQQPPTVP